MGKLNSACVDQHRLADFGATCGVSQARGSRVALVEARSPPVPSSMLIRASSGPGFDQGLSVAHRQASFPLASNEPLSQASLCAPPVDKISYGMHSACFC